MRRALRETVRRHGTSWLVWAVLTVTELALQVVLQWHLVIVYSASIAGFSLVQWLLGQETPDSELTRTQSEISAVFQLGLEKMCLLADLSKGADASDLADSALLRKRARAPRDPAGMGGDAHSYLPLTRLGLEPAAAAASRSDRRPFHLRAHQVAPSMSSVVVVLSSTKSCGYLISTSQCRAWTLNNHKRRR
jgi:hypothetical protein